jgi:hypothetical protein
LRMNLPYRASLVALACLAASSVALGQQLYVYPSKGQSQEQQSRDQYECYQWAVQQTGVDPTKVAGGPPAPPPPSGPGVAGGAARGAAVGAVGGAIGGNAGKGAAIGAAAGGMVGGIRRREQQAAYQQQQTAQANATAAQQSQYNRAMATCLQGRGYTVN